MDGCPEGSPGMLYFFPCAPTGLNQNSTSNFLSVQPNPGDGKFYLQLHSPLSEPIQLKVYNSMGVLVFSKDMDHGKDLFQLDLGGNSPGIYFLQLSGKEFGKPIKIIIQ
jgi:hypothetical protein